MVSTRLVSLAATAVNVANTLEISALVVLIDFSPIFLATIETSQLSISNSLSGQSKHPTSQNLPVNVAKLGSAKAGFSLSSSTVGKCQLRSRTGKYQRPWLLAQC